MSYRKKPKETQLPPVQDPFWQFLGDAAPAGGTVLGGIGGGVLGGILGSIPAPGPGTITGIGVGAAAGGAIGGGLGQMLNVATDAPHNQAVAQYEQEQMQRMIKEQEEMAKKQAVMQLLGKYL